MRKYMTGDLIKQAGDVTDAASRGSLQTQKTTLCADELRAL